MMKIVIMLFLSSVTLSALQIDPAKELARAERAFSAASEKNGIKASFLEYLSDDCVMFNPHPVNGKSLYRNRKASATYLKWFPTFVEVSASGDFGISTGPWELRPSKNDTNVLFGHYFSVWKKQKDGKWKVIIDNGMGYPSSVKRTEQEHLRTLKRNRSQQNSSTTEEQIVELEGLFASALERTGTVKAYEQFSAENILQYRANAFPTQTKNDALRLAADNVQGQKISVLHTHMALSGDLGYAYGYSVSEKNDSSTFIRVWRKDSGWKIAVDLFETFTK